MMRSGRDHDANWRVAVKSFFPSVCGGDELEKV